MMHFKQTIESIYRIYLELMLHFIEMTLFVTMVLLLLVLL